MPTSFVEMGPFVNDFIDFWLDANPEVHTKGEDVLRRSVANYLAYASVWKTKSKTSSIIDPVLMASAGKSLQIRNVLSHTVKTVFSYAKRNPTLNPQDLIEGFTEAFYLVTPLIHKIDTGELPLPEGKHTEDLTRLIGGFLAGDKAVIDAADKLRLIEY
ncbi:hypothetical protein [Desulfobacter postgatei]|uniref:hypothetical protein n=1 Tax=Desulfobacter postgatei TaxID=2293 RepID=UPI002FDB5897